MSNKIQVINILLFLIFTITSCGEKFDKNGWGSYGEVDGPSDRVSMAEDLAKTHKLIGLTHKEMLQLLGPPANYTDTTLTAYVLKEEYDMIDPISGKDLIITFNKDSIITSVKIEKWNKH